MNKIVPLLLGGLLLMGTAACNNAAKTSADAPNSAAESPQAPDTNSADATKKDVGNDVRRAQANADIAAREKRNQIAGNPQQRAAGDLESEVRSKLEVNIQGGQLNVTADKNGAVIVTGTVPKQADKTKIDTLTKQIKGVKSVNSQKVTVAAATNKDATKTAPNEKKSP